MVIRRAAQNVQGGNEGGNEGNRSRFITKLKDDMNEEIYVFSCPGVASIIMMQEKASSLVKAVSETDSDDTDSSMHVLSKKIKENVRKLPSPKNEYSVIDMENLADECSETLMTLLSKLSPNFEKTLPAVLIANIVTSVMTYMTKESHPHIKNFEDSKYQHHHQLIPTIKKLTQKMVL